MLKSVFSGYFEFIFIQYILHFKNVLLSLKDTTKISLKVSIVIFIVCITALERQGFNECTYCQILVKQAEIP